VYAVGGYRLVPSLRGWRARSWWLGLHVGENQVRREAKISNELYGGSGEKFQPHGKKIEVLQYYDEV
jgi:hypothetical protein